MRSLTEAHRSEPFRPFFWADGDFRICEWPESTVQALQIPAQFTIGRHCWDVVAEHFGGLPGVDCRRCPAANAARGSPLRDAPTGAAPARHCAILPRPGSGSGALVWLPLSFVTTSAFGSARLEGLVIRGILAERLGSIETALDGLRRACTADDCELFLLDSAGKELLLIDCEGYDRAAFMERTRMPLGTGYPGTVTLLQKPMFTNRIQKDRLFLRREVKRCGIRSYIGVPLGDGERPLGCIGMGWRDASVPMDWGLRVLEEVRSVIPLALPRRFMPARGVEVPATRLAIRCFGTFEVSLDGRTLGPADFVRCKALQLLKHLVLKRGAPVHRDRLVEILWPDAPARSGANRLHVVVNALRSTLEAGRGPRASEYIICRDDRYFFNSAASHSVDLYEFLDSLTTARAAQREGAEQRALGLLEDAVRLYRGDLFGDDTEDDSLDAHRVRLRHMYLDTVRTLAGMRIRSSQPDEAIWTLRAALEFEPIALDLYELLVTQLARAGRLAEARQQYDCCRAALRKHLDMELPQRIRALEKLLH